MHKQVTMLRKLLSHIFKHYADVQDDGYISDEDIKYPESFMPRPPLMLTGLQEPAPPQQPDTLHGSPHHNTEQRLEQDLRQIRRVLFPSETNQRMNQYHWMMSTLRTKGCTSRMTLCIGSMNHHRTDTYAFRMNTRTDANILEHHPVWIP